MSAADDESFLTRWSRRKAEARRPEALPVAPAPDTGGAEAAQPARPQLEPGMPASGADGVGAAEPAPAVALPTEADLASLDASSDYTRFMSPGVPEDLRNKALRRLWESDPFYGSHDGLDDYCGDYTDAACAVPAGLLKTAYKFGQGFLSDAEAAEWDRLGKPEAAEAEAQAEVGGADAAADGQTGEASDVADTPPQAAPTEMAAQPAATPADSVRPTQTSADAPAADVTPARLG